MPVAPAPAATKYGFSPAAGAIFLRIAALLVVFGEKLIEIVAADSVAVTGHVQIESVVPSLTEPPGELVVTAWRVHVLPAPSVIEADVDETPAVPALSAAHARTSKSPTAAVTPVTSSVAVDVVLFAVAMSVIVATAYQSSVIAVAVESFGVTPDATTKFGETVPE